MSLDCYVVKDLLPLYVEELVSESTAQSVKEHLESCNDCAAVEKTIRSEPAVKMTKADVKDDKQTLKRVRNRMRRHSASIAAMAALITATVITCVYGRFYIRPGDEMAFLLLFVYIGIPLVSFICSLVLGIKRSILGYFSPIISGLANVFVIVTLFRGEFDLFIFSLSAIPSLLGLVIGLMIAHSKHEK